MPVRFHPDATWHASLPGETLLQIAERAGVPIERVCGGRGTCGKCRVVLLEGELTPLTAAEQRHLSEDELHEGYRLACQALPGNASQVIVRIPGESRREAVRVLSSGVSNGLTLDPWVTRHYLEVPSADLEDQTADLDAVQRVWRLSQPDPLALNLDALRQLPSALRADGGRVTLVQVDGTVIRVSAGHATEPLLGMAYDIGTTTVVGYLMDLATGQELAVASELNPQTRHGDNVISRIQYADETPDGLRTLQDEIVGALNRILLANTQAVDRNPEDVLAMTVVGNTTMQHLLLAVSPAHLAQSPYVPAYTGAQCVTAGELGLRADPGAHIWLLPNIAGWVGADTVGVLLSTGIYAEIAPALAIDIGTNGEMAMGSRDRLITCSTAAGPAFEGAHISSGMRASAGAIDTVHIETDVLWHTIGDGTPRGVCGSGLVDAISELLRVGVIDTQGRIQSSEAVAELGYPALAARIQGENRHRTFDLVSASDAGADRPIRLTQRDVRELQLAKGAVRAGIEILMNELGLKPDQVRKVFLAGAFGNYIQPTSALGIGLLPHFMNAELVPVGNAAGSGTRLALLSRRLRTLADELLEHVEYIELSGRPDFQDEFVSAMLF
ncbi:MAG: ASKHA domain-containing protein [Anaerolineae bacterium]